ncbi:MAG TPA: hypothetical protein VJA22_00720 [Patescibacteria group bacterium]|nr:hypothetical protein [Patescibacteria group bacterium]
MSIPWRFCWIICDYQSLFDGRMKRAVCSSDANNLYELAEEVLDDLIPKHERTYPKRRKILERYLRFLNKIPIPSFLSLDDALIVDELIHFSEIFLSRVRYSSGCSF